MAFLSGKGPDPTLKAGEKSAEEELVEVLRERSGDLPGTPAAQSR